ncbi:hypothetical protein WJX84_004989 [Apatococcus fuscideae]
MGRRSKCAYRAEEQSEPEPDSEDEAEPRTRSKRLRKASKEDVNAEKMGKGSQGKGGSSRAQAAQKAGRSACQQSDGVMGEADAADVEKYEKQVNFYITEGDTLQAPAKLSVEERDKVIREAMRLMLFKQHSKPDQPVRRQEIVDAINSTTLHRPSNLSSYVIKQAQRRFAEVMGLEMKEIELKVHLSQGKGKSKLGGGSSSSSAYVLRSLLPASIREKYVEAGNVQYDKGFAMVVFSLLATNAGKISDGDLWAYLEQIGVTKGEVHPTFGKPELQLDTMEKQK